MSIIVRVFVTEWSYRSEYGKDPVYLPGAASSVWDWGLVTALTLLSPFAL